MEHIIDLLNFYTHILLKRILLIWMCQSLLSHYDIFLNIVMLIVVCTMIISYDEIN